MVDASALLGQLGVKHALVGGLAIGAYGYVRATKGVDFLVDDSAWLKTATGFRSAPACRPRFRENVTCLLANSIGVRMITPPAAASLVQHHPEPDSSAMIPVQRPFGARPGGSDAEPAGRVAP
jgi:hypothetical protein